MSFARTLAGYATPIAAVLTTLVNGHTLQTEVRAERGRQPEGQMTVLDVDVAPEPVAIRFEPPSETDRPVFRHPIRARRVREH